MTAERGAMESALKQVVVTDLRRVGFKGSLPHFRRILPDRIELLSVQFHSSGGSFVVEVATCGPDGHTTSWGEHTPPAKVRAQDIPRNRPRLGSPQFPHGDHWFDFGPRSYDEERRSPEPDEFYDRIATDVLRFVRQQAEPFWSQAP